MSTISMQSLNFPDEHLESESESIEIAPIQNTRTVKPAEPEIKISSSLEDLMNHVDSTQKHPNDTNYLLTTSLMALVVRQNLGSTLSEIKTALDQARQEYNKLSERLVARDDSPDTLHEGTAKNDPLEKEIKVMEETIKTLERALEKAEREHQDVITLGENLKLTQDHVQQIQVSVLELLEKMETVEQSLAKDCCIDEVKIKVLESLPNVVVKPNLDDDVPQAKLIKRLIAILVVLFASLIILIIFGISCKLFK